MTSHNSTYDCVLIGGGVIGLSLACELGRAGNRRDGIAVRKTGWRSIDSIDDVDWDELARLGRSSRANEAGAADQN